MQSLYCFRDTVGFVDGEGLLEETKERWRPSVAWRSSLQQLNNSLSFNFLWHGVGILQYTAPALQLSSCYASHNTPLAHSELVCHILRRPPRVSVDSFLKFLSFLSFRIFSCSRSRRSARFSFAESSYGQPGCSRIHLLQVFDVLLGVAYPV